MSLVRVWTDVGIDKYVSLYARIIKKAGDTFTIQYLSPTEHHTGQTVYRYENETYEITDESISHYLDTSDETEIGFKKFDAHGWVRVNADEDYEPSDEDEDEIDDEEEEFDDDEDDEIYDDEDDI